ncbi:MAG TPA: hypothetical protein VGK57_18110 [Candidatus Binatia bacterium]
MNAFKNSKYISSVAIILALALSVLSTPSTAWSSMRDDVREFHLFLQDHPRISSDLRANPNLVHNRRYMDQHDDLARFLRNRPGLRQEIALNPDRVFGRYYTNGRYRGYDRYDRFDRFGRWR